MTVGSRLGEDGAPIRDDLEPAARRGNQLNLGPRELALELGRQTGGPWLVVSDDAVFDRDAHGASLPLLGGRVES